MLKIDLDLLSLMTSPTTRGKAARSLAEQFGAKDLIIFDYDDEVGRFLPSLGFPQTIRGGKRWQELLVECSAKGSARSSLVFPTGPDTVAITAIKFDQLIWAFSGENLQTGGQIEDWRRLDINLAKMLKSERSAVKQESQNQILRELTNDLRSYANALNTAKSDLNKALQETEEARTLAEQANATKSAFLANMSHEIRTPLSAILGYNSLLKDPSLSSKDQNQFIDTIDRNGKALTRIIDDILDLAKVEAGKLEVEFVEFSLYELVHEAVDLFRDRANQKNISLSLNYDRAIPRSIFSDPVRLRQVLINIVGNAVKFTSRGAVQVTVSGTVDSKVEDIYRFELKVKDSGPGLNLEQKQRLFQPFMQGDNSVTRKFGGTGLGLVLSKRLTEALSGTIEISQFAVGEGCTFDINFPAHFSRQPASVPPTASIVQPPASLKGRLATVKVLLVDDAIDNQLLAKRFLMRCGANVDTASDGQEAIDKVLAGSYNIILMDIQMPVMDGYEAMSTLRAKGCQTPILALTAHAMLEQKAKSLAAGFDGHLSKPLNFEELIQAIHRHTKDHSHA